MGEVRFADGEKVAGSWSVYLGEESPTGAKITGKLHVTDRGVLFEAGLSLEEIAFHFGALSPKKALAAIQSRIAG